MKVTCGNANPNGNIALKFKGGCNEELNILDAYRCTGCGGWFHLDCILKHFELEEGHDNARNALKNIMALCEQGLKQNKPIKRFFPNKPLDLTDSLCGNCKCKNQNGKKTCRVAIEMTENKKICRYFKGGE